MAISITSKIKSCSIGKIRFESRYLCLRLARYAMLLALLITATASAQQFERPEGTAFRYLSWNVSRDNFNSRNEEIAAVLRAANADVIMLDELPKNVSADTLRTFAKQLDGQVWQVVLGIGGGAYQRSAVLSRQPSQRLAAFDRLGYPAAVRNRWLAGAGNERRALELNLSYGIPVTGAELEFTPFTLMVVGMDLQCCGNSEGAWEEQRRRIETETIRAALDESWTHQTAVVVSGDFNNVQGMVPANNLQGLHNANTARHLARVAATRADGQTDWTWDGRGTEFPSRPLDHVLHSDALTALNAFVLDTEHLPEVLLRTNKLNADHSRLCSDHRPVVVDFAWVVQVPPASAP